jgi:hypothetical protein
MRITKNFKKKLFVLFIRLNILYAILTKAAHELTLGYKLGISHLTQHLVDVNSKDAFMYGTD